MIFPIHDTQMGYILRYNEVVWPNWEIITLDVESLKLWGGLERGAQA